MDEINTEHLAHVIGGVGPANIDWKSFLSEGGTKGQGGAPHNVLGSIGGASGGGGGLASRLGGVSPA
jgi:hypothetical protein